MKGYLINYFIKNKNPEFFNRINSFLISIFSSSSGDLLPTENSPVFHWHNRISVLQDLNLIMFLAIFVHFIFSCLYRCCHYLQVNIYVLQCNWLFSISTQMINHVLKAVRWEIYQEQIKYIWFALLMRFEKEQAFNRQGVVVVTLSFFDICIFIISFYQDISFTVSTVLCNTQIITDWFFSALFSFILVDLRHWNYRSKVTEN